MRKIPNEIKYLIAILILVAIGFIGSCYNLKTVSDEALISIIILSTVLTGILMVKKYSNLSYSKKLFWIIIILFFNIIGFVFFLVYNKHIFQKRD